MAELTGVGKTDVVRWRTDLDALDGREQKAHEALRLATNAQARVHELLGQARAALQLAESAEEAKHLEIAYGPAQRWKLQILSLKEFVHIRDHGGTSVHAMNLDGIPAMTPNNALQRTGEHLGHAVRAMNGVRGPGRKSTVPAAEPSR
jgi:hypothetical protein